jgi:GH25 family lysozyme M1 (1,4-beta-N-acetylmuramidase)
MAKLLYSLIKSIDSEFNIKPIIYTSLSFWKSSIDKFANEYPFNDYRLWIAYWSSKSPVIPKPWNDYFIWQYTNKGTIDGITKQVDLNWLKTTANNKFPVKEFKEFDFYSEYKLKNFNSILKVFRIRDNF